MKVVLVGHPGSQKIVPASKFLTGKYLPGFDVTYLNYPWPVKGWAKYVAGFFNYLTDKTIIFALDDYLPAGPIDMEIFRKAEAELTEEVVNVKLCECSKEDHDDYPVTTQYTIWDREVLMEILHQVNTPWEFEIAGSKYFTFCGYKAALRTCLPYFTNSALSARWEGVKLDGLKDEDIQYMKNNGIL